MNDTRSTPDPADVAAADAVRNHHDQLAAALGRLVDALGAAAARSDSAAADTARQELVDWCHRELVPHALAEEKTMYPAAHDLPAGRLLVDGMLAEHQVIVGLVRELAAEREAVRAAAHAKALEVMFGSHLAKENDLVLPLLTATSGVSVAGLLAGMHELLGASEPEHSATDHAGHTATGGHDHV